MAVAAAAIATGVSACSVSGGVVPSSSTITVTVTASPSASGSVPSGRPAAPRWDVPAQGDVAATLLAGLTDSGKPVVGYSRAAFGERWSDDTAAQGSHSGCDTRNDVLRRDLKAVELKPGTGGCVVLYGSLADPYSGRVISFVRGVATSSAVQVDHVVSLGDGWQSGANVWTSADRATFANDPLNLVVVSGEANVSKGNQSAATWLPPETAHHCAYVGRQIAVKARWRLSVTVSERSAMLRVLAACPGQLAVTSPWQVPPRSGSSGK